MSAVSLVVLAAGQGTRFGGPKQLVAVRDDGATITDVLIERAVAVGIDSTVIVANRAVADELADGLRDRGHHAEVVVQPGRRGTAQALLTARGTTEGPVVVVNADDLYPQAAFAAVVEHLGADTADHAVVGFPVARTIVGDRPQSRALLGVDADTLTGVREGTVEPGAPMRFLPREGGVPEELRGDELVSMNLWALQRSVFSFAERALDDDRDDTEVYLPDVVGEMIRAGEVFRLVGCDAPCRGITFPEDVATLGPLL